MDLRHSILLGVGVLMLIKAVWAMARPDTTQALTKWWIGVARHVNTLTAIVAAFVAAALWICVLIHQTAADWLLLLLGLFLAWTASVYLRPEVLERVAARFILERSPAALRTMGLCAALIAALMIAVAVMGW